MNFSAQVQLDCLNITYWCHDPMLTFIYCKWNIDSNASWQILWSAHCFIMKNNIIDKGVVLLESMPSPFPFKTKLCLCTNRRPLHNYCTQTTSSAYLWQHQVGLSSGRAGQLDLWPGNCNPLTHKLPQEQPTSLEPWTEPRTERGV